MHACRAAGKHLFAMEADEDLFNNVLAPLIVGTSSTTQVETTQEEEPGSPPPETTLDAFCCK